MTNATTTIADLATTIQERHGIDNHRAAVEIVEVYVSDIADDPDLWDADTMRLTDEGVDVVSAAIKASIDQGLHGSAVEQLLIALENATIARREAEDSWKALIREALKTEATRETIAQRAGISIPRLYQIRDGR